MSDSETFLSRWLRLKRESEAALPPADAPAPAPPSPAAFDPASLPPIESIVADTDMQQFLHEAVPADLTRAALRSAWSADPAIRDFVGIAENQWNFNDHAGIPGFGPIEAADYLMAQAVGSLTNVAQETPQETSQETTQEMPQEFKHAGQTAVPGSEAHEAVRPAAAAPRIERTSVIVAPANAIETAGGEAGPGPVTAAPRSHGGALPQ
jgi:uncharacterized protein DUF3306